MHSTLLLDFARNRWGSPHVQFVAELCCRFGPENGGLSSMDPRIAVASTYLDALRSHDGSSVPLAPDAVRHEVGSRPDFRGIICGAAFPEVLSIA